MKLLNKLFKKKKKQEESQSIIESKPLIEPFRPEDNPNYVCMCEACNNPVYSYEKSNKLAGKRYHTKCLRKNKKEAIRQFYS
jgi:hypothetical protein